MMGSVSTSSIQKSFKYDVFLSFRGEDIRKTFIDHLYHALKQKSINTYKDDIIIEKGERISDQLIRSIEESRVHVIVFSKNYASSSWCLDELVKIMECRKTMEQTAYPVFYDVEPTEVRNQSGAVGEAFAKHARKEAAGRWRDALIQAAGLAGWELKTTFDGHEAKFIEKITEEISSKLHFIGSSDDDNLVGMEIRVKKVISSLETGLDDVRMIGIKGIGGGGKTTLARAVFNNISISFEGKSFVESVREVSKVSGLKELQKQILQDVLNDLNIDVKSVYDGKIMMKKMMAGRKVVVVLDDVDHIDQLKALVGEPTWFKQGSKIIITTRDKQVLVAHGVCSDNIHDVNLLSDEEAICLFSRWAFKREFPIQDYEELSRKVVHYAAGLPLTITVLGSFLCGRDVREWEDALERLKTIPEDQTLKRLELSYNGLENDQKEIFLDVACFLRGETKGNAVRILERCGFKARIGLSVLEQKSLITISDTYGLRMHDLIAEMGWNIVRRLHPDEPSRHNRLWIKEEIEDVLVNESGTEATTRIKLKDTDLHPAIIMKGLRNMRGLKFLYVDDGCRKWNVDEASQYLPDALVSLYWPRYPFCCLPKTFRANKLVNLEMEGSNMSQLWEIRDRKALHKLRFLQLSGSKLETFDLGMTPNLEILSLNQCNEFVELYMPVACPKLKVLNLSGSKVSNLNLGLTPHLERLDLKHCYCLQEIHAPLGCLEKLSYLNLSGCLRFEYFWVDKQYKLPGLDYLATLELTAESRDICPLHPSNNLPKFQFDCFYHDPLSSLSGNVKQLISFGLCACTNLESFSASICGLQRLGKLTLEGSIPEVPKDMWQLKSLEKLSLWMKEIKHLPDSICMLKHLKYLDLESCWLLEQLPMDLGRLECLEELHLTNCISLRDIPNSICMIKCLKKLYMMRCTCVRKLPEELGRLECLQVLYIEGTSILYLPQSIFQLKGLEIGWSRWRLESYGLKHYAMIGNMAYCYV